MHRVYWTILSAGLLTLCAVSARGDAIKNGDFADEATLKHVAGKWDFGEHELGQWYAPVDRHGRSLYEVAPGGGHARAATSAAVDAKLLQVIASPAAGSLEVAFEYRLTNPADQRGLVRVYGIDPSNGNGKGKDNGNGKGREGFKLKLDGTDPGISSGSATLLYGSDLDGGLKASPGGWTTVTTSVTPSASHAYLAVYGVFSHDGADGLTEGDWAAIRGVAVTPEPATAGLLVLGGLGLLRSARRGKVRP